MNAFIHTVKIRCPNMGNESTNILSLVNNRNQMNMSLLAPALINAISVNINLSIGFRHQNSINLAYFY